MLVEDPQPCPRVALAEDLRVLPLLLPLAHLQAERWLPLSVIPSLEVTHEA